MNPRKSEVDKQNKLIGVPVSPTEKELIVRYCRKLGLTAGTYMRYNILKEIKDEVNKGIIDN